MAKIRIKKELNPVFYDTAEVKKIGTGGGVHIPKKHIGKKAHIIIEEK